MALRTASDTSGAERLDVAIGVGNAVRETDVVGVAAVLPACGTGVGCCAAGAACAFAARRAESSAALRVAVCGVTTVRAGAPEAVLPFFSTTEDKDSGKRLGLPVIRALSSGRPTDWCASGQSATA